MTALANDLRPTDSRQLGNTEFRRLRIGGYRVLYEVDDAQAAIIVHTFGRAPIPPA